jgi:hypothetical protein
MPGFKVGCQVLVTAGWIFGPTERFTQYLTNDGYLSAQEQSAIYFAAIFAIATLFGFFLPSKS